MHEAIRTRNKKSKKELDCIGALIEYIGRIDEPNAKADYNKIENDTFTYGAVVPKTIMGWSKWPNKLLKIANNNQNKQQPGKKGCIICIGGGATVKDIITLGSTGDKEKEIKPVPFFLFDKFGESKEKLETLNESRSNEIYGFEDARTLITKLYEHYGKEIFIPEFDIDKIEEYVMQAQKDVRLDYEIFENELIAEGKFKKQQLDSAKEFIDRGIDIETVLQIMGNNQEYDIEDVRLYLESYKLYIENKKSPEKLDETINGCALDEIRTVEGVSLNDLQQRKNSERGD